MKATVPAILIFMLSINTACDKTQEINSQQANPTTTPSTSSGSTTNPAIVAIVTPDGARTPAQLSAGTVESPIAASTNDAPEMGPLKAGETTEDLDRRAGQQRSLFFDPPVELPGGTRTKKASLYISGSDNYNLGFGYHPSPYDVILWSLDGRLYRVDFKYKDSYSVVTNSDLPAARILAAAGEGELHSQDDLVKTVESRYKQVHNFSFVDFATGQSFSASDGYRAFQGDGVLILVLGPKATEEHSAGLSDDGIETVRHRSRSLEITYIAVNRMLPLKPDWAKWKRRQRSESPK